MVNSEMELLGEKAKQKFFAGQAKEDRKFSWFIEANEV